MSWPVGNQTFQQSRSQLQFSLRPTVTHDAFCLVSSVLLGGFGAGRSDERGRRRHRRFVRLFASCSQLLRPREPVPSGRTPAPSSWRRRSSSPPMASGARGRENRSRTLGRRSDRLSASTPGSCLRFRSRWCPFGHGESRVGVEGWIAAILRETVCRQTNPVAPVQVPGPPAASGFAGSRPRARYRCAASSNASNRARAARCCISSAVSWRYGASICGGMR